MSSQDGKKSTYWGWFARTTIISQGLLSMLNTCFQVYRSAHGAYSRAQSSLRPLWPRLPERGLVGVSHYSKAQQFKEAVAHWKAVLSETTVLVKAGDGLW